MFMSPIHTNTFEIQGVSGFAGAWKQVGMMSHAGADAYSTIYEKKRLRVEGYKDWTSRKPMLDACRYYT